MEFPSTSAEPEQPPIKLPRPWVTYGFIASTVAVFLLQLWFSKQYEGQDVLGERLAFSQNALDEHRYWTVISYGWVHALSLFGHSNLYLLHILGNMLGLYYLGPLVETLLGHMRFFWLYLGGIVAAALTWYLFSFTPEGIIGASGAVFALIAAAGTVAPRFRVVVYLFFILPIPTTLRTMALVLCGVELVLMVTGYFSNIGHSAHLGGAVFGFIYTLVCLRTMPEQFVIQAGNSSNLV